MLIAQLKDTFAAHRRSLAVFLQTVLLLFSEQLVNRVLKASLQQPSEPSMCCATPANQSINPCTPNTESADTMSWLTRYGGKDLAKTVGKMAQENEFHDEEFSFIIQRLPGWRLRLSAVYLAPTGCSRHLCCSSDGIIFGHHFRPHSPQGPCCCDFLP